MRKALLLLLIGAALSGCGVPSTAATPTAPPSYRASVLADHPVAYWRLSEATGAVMADASGNGNDGTYAGAVTRGQPGALASEGNTAVAKQTADPLYVGRRADGLFNDAVLDEIAIYPTALSSDRIAAHWRAASTH